MNNYLQTFLSQTKRYLRGEFDRNKPQSQPDKCRQSEMEMQLSMPMWQNGSLALSATLPHKR